MAALDKITDALAALDAKVTAHLDADGAAVLAMVKKNEELQARITELEGLLVGSSVVTEEQVAAVVAQADAIGARL